MVEIKCPKCGEQIKISKDEYATLLNEISKEEIENEVERREIQFEKRIKAEYALDAKKKQEEQEKKISELEREKLLLESKLNSSDKDQVIAVNKATESIKEELGQTKEEIIALKSDLETAKKEYEIKLRLKEEEVERWKNFRMGDSTKDLGESLEKYCQDAFDEIRAIAYPNAYFGKDNIVDEEGKGDYIFKDYQDGIEIVSIMFEMKNQKDTTKTKHKNEDFFAKLDKNRESKKCEYAVLVSTLEEDSKLYNSGIVDVSYKYKKMYVVRPQFFLSIIGLIRNMAKNSFGYKKQVIEYQKENIDITNFEGAVKAITAKINKDYEKAGEIYGQVDKLCNDIIKKVENFREEFKSATNWIGKAQKQLPELEIKRLTKGNKTMKEKFEALHNETH